jgi:hypothetical protein
LASELAALGWRAHVRETTWQFMDGEAERA